MGNRLKTTRLMQLLVSVVVQPRGEAAGEGVDRTTGWGLGDDLASVLSWATASANTLLCKERRPGYHPSLQLVPVPQCIGEFSEPFPRSWIATTRVPDTPPTAPATPSYGQSVPGTTS